MDKYLKPLKNFILLFLKSISVVVVINLFLISMRFLNNFFTKNIEISSKFDWKLFQHPIIFAILAAIIYVVLRFHKMQDIQVAHLEMKSYRIKKLEIPKELEKLKELELLEKLKLLKEAYPPKPNFLKRILNFIVPGLKYVSKILLLTIIIGVALGVLFFFCVGLFKLFRLLVNTRFLLDNSFLVILAIVAIILQFTLRKKVILKQNWKKLTTVWLKFTGVTTISVGGFGFLGLVPYVKNEIFKITLSSDYINIHLLITIYIIVIALIVLSRMLIKVGKSISGDEDTNIPLKIFISSFIVIWLSNLGVYSLFFNCFFLTLHAHITT